MRLQSIPSQNRHGNRTALPVCCLSHCSREREKLQDDSRRKSVHCRLTQDVDRQRADPQSVATVALQKSSRIAPTVKLLFAEPQSVATVALRKSSRIALTVKLLFAENPLPAKKPTFHDLKVIFRRGGAMKAALGQFASIVCMMSAMALVSSGCTVGGKSFAIDSNSRVPFFGLELKESKRKQSAPAYRSIARSSSDEISVKVALQSMSSSPAIDLKRNSSKLVSTQFIAAPTDLAAEKRKTRSSDSERATVTQEPVARSIPLPRTDELPGARERRTATTSVDFQ